MTFAESRRGSSPDSKPLFSSTVLQRKPTFFPGKNPVGGGIFLQPKLTLNEPGDRYEQEADAVAEAVVSRAEVGTTLTPLNGTGLQRAAEPEAAGDRENLVSDVVNSPGQALDGPTQDVMSRRLGHDFSRLQLHTDAKAAESARSIQARAYTSGQHVVFGEGQYAPATEPGQRLLAHELAHVVQQTGGGPATTGPIQRVPMPNESTVTGLDTYTEATRQGIRYDIGFNLSSVLSRYFAANIVMDVRSGFNVTFVVRGFPAAESWVESAMRALALYNFNFNDSATEAAIVNFTTVQHLDMSMQTNPAATSSHGPNALVRFTAREFDATGRGASRTRNVQLVVEKLSNVTAPPTSTETPAARRSRYASTYRIINAVPQTSNDPIYIPPADAISDAQFDQVLDAMALVPAGILNGLTDIPIHRGLAAVGPHGEVGEYSQSRPAGATAWQRRITLYADFFTSTLAQRVFILTHELGHAADYRPNESATGSGGVSLSAAAAFRTAVRQDGGLRKGISEYAATTTDYSEYYAEAFSLYLNQRSTLQVLRPHVYAYFLAQFP